MLDVTWVHEKVNEIAKDEQARVKLASWFNGLTPRQRETVLSYAGWLDPKGYAPHYMDAGGTDIVFEELAGLLNIP